VNSAELIELVLLNCTFDTGDVDYTSAVILRELNTSLQTTFEAPVVQVREGYWCKPAIFTVTAGVSKYRIPARSAAGGLEKVELGFGAIPSWTKLDEVREEMASSFELAANQFGQPRYVVVRGDQIVVMPTPDSGTYQLRMWYYIRPSRLVTQQSTTLFAGTIRGQVSAVNPTTRTITVNVVPFDMEAVAAGVITPTAITSANQRIDVIHPDGWQEISLVGAPQTLAGSVFTVGGLDDMSEIQVGDFVRAAGQTDWPCIPEDFHRCLADTTSVKMLTQRNYVDKAGSFASSVNADIQRFESIIQPRIKAEAITINAPLPALRGVPTW
jgi:hypothetical protein